MNRRYWILIGGAVAATWIGGLALHEHEPDTGAPAISEAEAQVLALEVLWPEHRDDVCTSYSELPDNLSHRAKHRVAIAAMEEAFGKPITGRAQDRFVELLDAC